MARAAIDAAALDYIEAEGTCVGCADVRAGTVIAVDGVGRRFSGPYYVTATTHTYTAARGYRTRFAARRNAS
jgi:phage protein D